MDAPRTLILMLLAIAPSSAAQGAPARHRPPAAPTVLPWTARPSSTAAPVALPAPVAAERAAPTESTLVSTASSYLASGPTTPVDGGTADLLAWHRRNALQLAAVEHAWAALLDRLVGFRPGEFDRQCDGLATSLARLDQAVLLPAPDRLIDLYVRRLAVQLHAAATACSAQQLFNVVYRLEEARAALAEIRWLVEQRTGSATALPR